MKQVLFVCLGNICRSPLAQGVFEKRIREMGLEQEFSADSAGTSGWHEGEPPHGGSRKVAKANGIDISRQRSRPVSTSDNQQFDFLVAMDRSNYDSLTNEFGIDENKVVLMRSFESKQGSENVPDPWGRGEAAFQEVFDILDDCITGFIHYALKS